MICRIRGYDRPACFLEAEFVKKRLLGLCAAFCSMVVWAMLGMWVGLFDLPGESRMLWAAAGLVLVAIAALASAGSLRLRILFWADFAWLRGFGLMLMVASIRTVPGMPQLDFATFPNQIFWLIVTLVVIYFVLSRIALPRIGAVLAGRVLLQNLHSSAGCVEARLRTDHPQSRRSGASAQGNGRRPL